MKFKKMTTFIVTVGSAGVFLLTSAIDAQAWSQARHDRHDRQNRQHYQIIQKPHHSPYNHRKSVRKLPYGSISIAIGNLSFYFHNGIYYRKDYDGYLIVSAPVGACISRLPFGYRTVRVNNRRFYVYNNVYYQHTTGGYVVVADPTINRFDTHITQTTNTDGYNKQVITINIPNKNGYKTITLTKEGDGFIGPQGEYYPFFPKVEDLKIIYGG